MAAVEGAGRASADVGNATHDLYRRYGKQIYAYCLHKLRSKEEAEDAAQTTFMNAFRSLQRGNTAEFEQAWLFKIAQNVCHARASSSSRRLKLEAPNDFEVLQEIVPGAESTDGSLELIGVEEALERMPENQRRAILLREWQGLSYKEIAAELDVTQTAVEMLIFRARRTLAGALEQPAETKARVARLAGAFGSLAGALKTLLTGGAAIKAATVAAAAVAVVGDGASYTIDKTSPSPATPRPSRVAAAAATPAPSATGIAAVADAPVEVTSASRLRPAATAKPARVASATSSARTVAAPEPVAPAAPPTVSAPPQLQPAATAAPPHPAPAPVPAPTPAPAPAPAAAPAPAPAAPPADEKGREETEEGEKGKAEAPSPNVAIAPPAAVVPVGPAEKGKDREKEGGKLQQPPVETAPVDPVPVVTTPVETTAAAQPPSNGNGHGNGHGRDEDKDEDKDRKAEAPAPAAPVLVAAPVADRRGNGNGDGRGKAGENEHER